MPYIEVWVDDDDLTYELDEADDKELIEEIQKRGYTVYGKFYDIQDDIGKLYSTYNTMPFEFFEKELKKFFRYQLYDSD